MSKEIILVTGTIILLQERIYSGTKWFPVTNINFLRQKKYPANFVLKKPGTIIGKLIRKWKWHYTKQHIRVNWPTKLDKINLQKLIVNIKLNTLLIIQNLYIANEQIEFGKAKVASESHYLRKNTFQGCEAPIQMSFLPPCI